MNITIKIIVAIMVSTVLMTSCTKNVLKRHFSTKTFEDDLRELAEEGISDEQINDLSIYIFLAAMANDSTIMNKTYEQLIKESADLVEESLN